MVSTSFRTTRLPGDFQPRGARNRGGFSWRRGKHPAHRAPREDGSLGSRAPDDGRRDVRRRRGWPRDDGHDRHARGVRVGTSGHSLLARVGYGDGIRVLRRPRGDLPPVPRAGAALLLPHDRARRRAACGVGGSLRPYRAEAVQVREPGEGTHDDDELPLDTRLHRTNRPLAYPFHSPLLAAFPE